MKSLRKLADSRGKTSKKFREKRFSVFQSFINSHHFNTEGKITILDVGGTIHFWEQMGFIEKQNVEITILNLQKEEINHYSHIKCILGNGCDMKEFTDNTFDVVFSNSVIEHVRTFQNQEKMAKEIQRVGKAYFLQTPNYWYFLEPHFLFFGFQFLPIKARAFLLRKFQLGWYPKIKDYNRSIEIAQRIRLLRKKELKKLFPSAMIVKEKLFGFTKSFMVYKRKNF